MKRFDVMDSGIAVTSKALCVITANKRPAKSPALSVWYLHFILLIHPQ